MQRGKPNKDLARRIPHMFEQWADCTVEQCMGGRPRSTSGAWDSKSAVNSRGNNRKIWKG